MNSAWHFTPILAAGLHEILGIVFVIISILSYFVSAIRGNEEIAAPKKKKPKAGNQGVTDLEEFLRQVVEQKQQQQGDRPNQPDRTESRSVPRTESNRYERRDERSDENREATNRNAQAKMKAKQRQPVRRNPAGQSTPAAPAASEKLRPVGEGVATTHLPTSSLGTVKEHLSNYMGTRVAQETASHLSHVGEGRVLRASTPVEGVHASQIHPLASLLLTFEGARNAIVLREILDRPKGLARKSPTQS